MADGKSKSEAARQLLSVLGEEVEVVMVDNVEAGNERSTGRVKPRADEDHEANKSKASWRLFSDGIMIGYRD